MIIIADKRTKVLYLFLFMWVIMLVLLAIVMVYSSSPELSANEIVETLVASVTSLVYPVP
jgi:hypothetical protein